MLEQTAASVTASGNAAATVFSFDPMVISAASELEVWHVKADRTITRLQESASSSGYSVTVARYPGTGSITYPATGGTALPRGDKLVIRRNTEKKQGVDLENQGNSLPENIERQLDRLTAMVQEVAEATGRALKLDVDGYTGITAGDYTNASLTIQADGRVTAIASGRGGDALLQATEAVRDQAVAAQTGAETARTGAETARTGAETARTGAETARTGAETARTGAETAKTGAEAARDQAQSFASGGQAKITTSDTTAGFLDDKISVASGLKKRTVNPGRNEKLEIAPDLTKTVTATSTDTRPGTLTDKLKAGDGIATTETNNSGVETLRVSISDDYTDEQTATMIALTE